MKMSMQSSINLADPMNRESSGTAWVPDSTPMYGHMIMFGDDMLMLHGGIFPRYTNVSSGRGDDRIDAPNWVMGMYSHPFSDATQRDRAGNRQLHFDQYGSLILRLSSLPAGSRGKSSTKSTDRGTL